MIYFPIYAFTPANDKNVGFAKEIAPIIGPFMMFGGIIDLPISVTVDTLIFPWEIYRSDKKGKIEKKVQNSEAKTVRPTK
jgi:hypothetical protein